jgi:hypothetical protein
MSNGWGMAFGQGLSETSVLETTVDQGKHFQGHPHVTFVERTYQHKLLAVGKDQLSPKF